MPELFCCYRGTILKGPATRKKLMRMMKRAWNPGVACACFGIITEALFAIDGIVFHLKPGIKPVLPMIVTEI